MGLPPLSTPLFSYTGNGLVRRHATSRSRFTVHTRRLESLGTRRYGAKYICHICERAAAKAANLCEAVEI